MWNKNIETFLGCDNEYQESKIVLFGAPFDSTTSFRPGTRFASHTMRGESYGLETYSPYQEKDLEDYAYFDGGDLELCFGDAKQALEQIEEYATKLLNDEKLPLMIGGEHLVTLGNFRAALKKYPNIHVIHLDAHTDLREEYLGVSLSHACVMKRIWDLIGDHRIHQFGIRSGLREEFIWAKEHTDLHPFNLKDLPSFVDTLGNIPIYLSIDLDVLDPSVFPGTGTPEPGGVGFLDLLHSILLMNKLTIVGCDINELSPMLDASGTSTAVACKILRELLLALSK